MSDVGTRVTGLRWGVKQSFRSYVEATGGAIEVADGAERLDDGGFGFPPAATGGLNVSDGAPSGQGAFVGEIRFDAHGGMLAVRLADPSVEVRDGDAGLWATDRRYGDRLRIANLDLGAARTEGSELVIPAKVTLDGMQVLGDHYPPGTVLDPVRLTLG